VVPDSTFLPRLLPLEGESDLDAHFNRWGAMPGGGYALIDEVERSGLTGRGGAGFPMAVKLRAVADRGRSVVVGNGSEHEPISRKDKVLMATAPHLVLDGLSIAAETVGADEAVLCISRGNRVVASSLSRALVERSAVGADRVAVRVEQVPEPYVTGEESALVHWLNGGESKPTFVPPRPFERGVRGRPTLVSNVETLAHLALVARFGAPWFRAVGTPGDPGSSLVTITGDVARSGVYEVALGAGLASTIAAACPEGTPKAVLIGGYSGVWLSGQSLAHLTFDNTTLRRSGATIGSGSIAVVGPATCGLQEVANVARWMAGQSAGQCGPCVHGLPAIADALENLVAGDRRGAAARRVSDLAAVVARRGACGHPDGVVRMVISALKVFDHEIALHRRQGGACRSRQLLPVPGVAGVWR
jgi:NADH:ubiquinone oxidoreductase subunit F (NADH-binding)